MQSLYQMYGENVSGTAAKKQVDKFFKFDKDQNGLLSEQEFVNGCLSDQEMLNFFVPNKWTNHGQSRYTLHFSIFVVCRQRLPSQSLCVCMCERVYVVLLSYTIFSRLLTYFFNFICDKTFFLKKKRKI